MAALTLLLLSMLISSSLPQQRGCLALLLSWHPNDHCQVMSMLFTGHFFSAIKCKLMKT